jgi:penicillin-binding protein 1A
MISDINQNRSEHRHLLSLISKLGSTPISVFVGFDQPEAMGESEQGATVAVPIWIDFMKVALSGTEENIMRRPNGLVDRLINRDTGEIARPGQANTTFELFIEDLAPAIETCRPSDSPSSNNNECLFTEMIF